MNVSHLREKEKERAKSTTSNKKNEMSFYFPPLFSFRFSYVFHKSHMPDLKFLAQLHCTPFHVRTHAHAFLTQLATRICSIQASDASQSPESIHSPETSQSEPSSRGHIHTPTFGHTILPPLFLCFVFVFLLYPLSSPNPPFQPIPLHLLLDQFLNKMLMIYV